jgi:hypothetical protein
VPLFHAAGIFTSIMMPLYWDVPVALGIGHRPLSSPMVIECLDNLDADSVLLPPVILEELSQSEETMKPLKKLSFAAFAGGKYSCSSRPPFLKDPLITH